MTGAFHFGQFVYLPNDFLLKVKRNGLDAKNSKNERISMKM